MFIRFDMIHERDTDIQTARHLINRFFMKLFKTSNIRIVQLCQELFHFELPSVHLARRRKLFLDKFCVCV